MTISSNATLTISAASTASETASVTVLPVAASGEGRGRLIHPVLGTYDYERGPDQWVNLDGDVIIPPVWSHSATLGGGADTLWDGNIRDVVVSEVWSQSIVPLDHVRALLSYWTQPPNPDSGYVEWWPSYTSELGFNVVIESVSGPQGALLLDHVSRQGYARGPVTMSLRIVSRAE